MELTEPLSKFSLNKQIVSMRHIVRKSKVHTINKLSRESKKLKVKKGSEEQVIKNKNKADRFVNELMVLKKLNDDVVSKYALQNEVPSATILNNVDISLETKALARLAGHKFVIDAVQCFRTKYPDWRSNLTELLNELGAKYRDKKKLNNNKTVKVKKEVKPKILQKNDKLISNTNEFEGIQSESKDDIDSVDYETDSNQLNVTEENNLSEIVQVEKSLAEENYTSSSEEDQNNEVNELKFVNSSQTTISQNKNKNTCDKNEITTQVEINVLDKQISELVNNKIPEKKLNSSTNLSIVDTDVEHGKTSKRKADKFEPGKIINKKKRTNEDDIKPVCETVDSFFMTVDNKDYMSVYKPPPVVETNDNEELPRIEYPKPVKEIFIKGKKVTLGKRNSMGNRRERRQQQVEEPVDTVLHPSWEAKRKQKSLAKFEGKKITFDDQD